MKIRIFAFDMAMVVLFGYLAWVRIALALDKVNWNLVVLASICLSALGGAFFLMLERNRVAAAMQWLLFGLLFLVICEFGWELKHSSNESHSIGVVLVSIIAVPTLVALLAALDVGKFAADRRLGQR